MYFFAAATTSVPRGGACAGATVPGAVRPLSAGPRPPSCRPARGCSPGRRRPCRWSAQSGGQRLREGGGIAAAGRGGQRRRGGGLRRGVCLGGRGRVSSAIMDWMPCIRPIASVMLIASPAARRGATRSRRFRPGADCSARRSAVLTSAWWRACSFSRPTDRVRAAMNSAAGVGFLGLRDPCARLCRSASMLWDEDRAAAMARSDAELEMGSSVAARSRRAAASRTRTELERERARASPVAAWSCWIWRRRRSPASENSRFMLRLPESK